MNDPWSGMWICLYFKPLCYAYKTLTKSKTGIFFFTTTGIAEISRLRTPLPTSFSMKCFKRNATSELPFLVADLCLATRDLLCTVVGLRWQQVSHESKKLDDYPANLSSTGYLNGWQWQSSLQQKLFQTILVLLHLQSGPVKFSWCLLRWSRWYFHSFTLRFRDLSIGVGWSQSDAFRMLSILSQKLLKCWSS